MTRGLPSGKLTYQWKIHHLKMYFLLEKVNVHCHVSLLEGTLYNGSYTRGFPTSLYNAGHLENTSQLAIRLVTLMYKSRIPGVIPIPNGL